MRKYLFLLLLLSLHPEAEAHASSKALTKIPFDMVGTYVVFRVGFNEGSHLNFLLDSGISSTLITELSAEDSVLLKYTEKTSLKGLGLGEDLEVWVSNGNNMQIGKIQLKNQKIMILVEDIFNLSKHTGFKINGIVGADVFEDHVVRVDYSRKNIYLYDTVDYLVPVDFREIPISLEGTKMFMDVEIEDPDGRLRVVRMLIDTGAELAAWFRSYGKNPVPIPENRLHGYIGRGLNGDIEGAFGRMPTIWIAGYPLSNAVVSFPDSASIVQAISNTQRDGTIGSQILSRFDLIFDQPGRKLYVRPNWNYKKKFSYNIAGVEVVQHNESVLLPEVLNIRKDSPGELAGVEPGDLILEINGLNGFKTSINEVKNIFETPSKSVQLILLRNGKTIHVRIPMKKIL
jgi:hypothetical protein